MKIKLLSSIWHSIRNWRTRLKFAKLIIGYDAKVANATFGKNVFIGDNVLVQNSSISDFSYVGDYSFINNSVIGKFCSVGPRVLMGMGKHPANIFVSTSPYFYAPKDFKKFSFADKNYFDEYEKITIGNDVWIGANVIIMDGIKIGHGVIIAAGAVVTTNLLDYGIYIGVPAKLLKFRFSEEEIKFLLESEWWNESEIWMKNNFKLFHNIKTFMQGYDRKNREKYY